MQKKKNTWSIYINQMSLAEDKRYRHSGKINRFYRHIDKQNYF